MWWEQWASRDGGLVECQFGLNNTSVRQLRHVLGVRSTWLLFLVGGVGHDFSTRVW